MLLVVYLCLLCMPPVRYRPLGPHWTSGSKGRYIGAVVAGAAAAGGLLDSYTSSGYRYGPYDHLRSHSNRYRSEMVAKTRAASRRGRRRRKYGRMRRKPRRRHFGRRKFLGITISRYVELRGDSFQLDTMGGFKQFRWNLNDLMPNSSYFQDFKYVKIRKLHITVIPDLTTHPSMIDVKKGYALPLLYHKVTQRIQDYKWDIISFPREAGCSAIDPFKIRTYDIVPKFAATNDIIGEKFPPHGFAKNPWFFRGDGIGVQNILAMGLTWIWTAYNIGPELTAPIPHTLEEVANAVGGEQSLSEVTAPALRKLRYHMIIKVTSTLKM